MAAAPRLKVYTEDGEYVAAVKYAEDAAMIVGPNGTIRDGHRKVVWHEGAEDSPAGASVDEAAATINDRLAAGRR